VIRARPLNTSPAIRLSPLDTRISHAFGGLGIAHLMVGDYDEAVKFERQAMREQPRNAVAYRVVAASLALLGRTEEARSAMRALLAVTPNLAISHARINIPYIEERKPIG
jgi:adenylate cyclase